MVYSFRGAVHAAMYSAKKKGRDGWREYNEESHSQVRQQLSITNGLRLALEKNEFELLYQPIVDTVTEKIIGAEALLRWYPDGGKPVSPVIFIPIAEMSGSIDTIGKFVFEKACLANKFWQENLPVNKIPYLSVNVSTRQLDDPKIVDFMAQTLKKTGAKSSELILEITETSLMANVMLNKKILHDLAGLGLSMAVDDFGTGYSSLSQLMDMPVHKLKIDKVFIDGLDKITNKTIVSAVIRMAHTMGLSVIAEGVETIEQVEILRSLKCDHIQGYYFHKPIRFEEINKLLKL